MVGMSEIKERRLKELEVDCHPGTNLGEYVPFYFCPRSIMLYLLHMGNHPSLSYSGGQAPIVHLRADLNRVIDWADAIGANWAFSATNAGARYTTFYRKTEHLAKIDWAAVASLDFRSSSVKEGKQAEFLVYGYVPWNLVERIGVFSASMKIKVEGVMKSAGHRPPVEVKPDWYF